MFHLSNNTISTWPQFAHKVRKHEPKLLNQLDKYSNSILVAGCQRSGTTMLARLISNSDEVIDFRVGHDNELDAALILSGRKDAEQSGRHCFQTTYLNENYKEYFEHTENSKMIWVVRNPYSVVYSLLYHWRRFAFKELFQACGSSLLGDEFKKRSDTFGYWSVPKIIRACLSYNGKSSQLFDLVKHFDDEHLLVIDYDNLISNKETAVEAIFNFLDLPFNHNTTQSIRSGSVQKEQHLSAKERKVIREISYPVYENVRSKALIF